MRIALTLLLCAGLSTVALAQKHNHSEDDLTYEHPVMQHKAVQWFGNFHIDGDPATQLRTHIFSELPHLLGSVLELDEAIESPAGKHYHFSQSIANQRVFGSEIVAHVDLNNKVRLITANTYSTSLTNGSPIVENGPYLYGEEFLRSPSTGVWFYDGSRLQPYVRQVLNDGLNFEEFVANASGQVIWERDLNLHVDTTISVRVYNPDPLTKARSTYKDPFKDEQDHNTAVLDTLMETKEVLATYDNGIFRLENNWIRIDDFDAPNTAVITSTSPQFHFSRSLGAFEQVNAYYHITKFQFYLQDLGFNLVNYQLVVDANAYSGADNSAFNRGTSPPSIRFGDGGVDDAEDADVVLHEYGHAISHSASPGSNSGTERGCIDEAFGDYIAASVSRSINPYGFFRVFSWDGHNEYWDGRWAWNVENKHYSNLAFTSIYKNTDIYTSALMEIWGKIGREATDRIVLQSAYSFSSNMTMPQAALAVVDADSILYDGAHIQPIWEAFATRGILPANTVSVDGYNRVNDEVKFYNTSGFAEGKDLIVSVSENNSYSYQLIHLNGQVAQQGTIPQGQSQWKLAGERLNSGPYILVITSTSGNTYTQKLIRVSN